VAGLILLLTFVHCSKDDPDTSGNLPGQNEPGASVLRSFENLYPEAESVVWSVEEGYHIADFMFTSQKASAWFESNGGLALEKMPASYREEIAPVVSEAFSRTSYASWTIKEACVLSRRGLEAVYELGVTNNRIVSNLYFTRYGDLIKIIDDVHPRTDTPINIPAALSAEVKRRFPNAQIVDISVVDAINSEISVGMVENTVYKNAVFNKYFVWVVSFWNVTEETIPPVVWTGFQATSYAALPLLRIRGMQTATATFYLFYVINNNRTMIVEFNSQGQLVSTVSRNHPMARYLLLR
jgi:hypothetical protein